jgi:hypothetical protein
MSNLPRPIYDDNFSVCPTRLLAIMACPTCNYVRRLTIISLITVETWLVLDEQVKMKLLLRSYALLQSWNKLDITSFMNYEFSGRRGLVPNSNDRYRVRIMLEFWDATKPFSRRSILLIATRSVLALHAVERLWNYLCASIWSNCKSRAKKYVRPSHDRPQQC